jgi:hypothetical protein
LLGLVSLGFIMVFMPTLLDRTQPVQVSPRLRQARG